MASLNTHCGITNLVCRKQDLKPQDPLAKTLNNYTTMDWTSWGKSPIDVDHISSCFSRKKFLQETHNFSTCSMMILQKDGEIRVSYLSFEIRSLIVVVGTMASGSILLPIRVLLRLRGELILCVQDIGSYLSQVVLEILQHLQVPPHPGVVCTPPLIPRTGLPRCTQTQKRLLLLLLLLWSPRNQKQGDLNLQHSPTNYDPKTKLGKSKQIYNQIEKQNSTQSLLGAWKEGKQVQIDGHSIVRPNHAQNGKRKGPSSSQHRIERSF